MRILYGICWILLVLGGLNWGIVGLFEVNVIDALFGIGSAISRIIYIVIGLAAVYQISCCSSCNSKNKNS